ncbi:hypothetical protein, partial [Hymenobacter agri]
MLPASLFSLFSARKSIYPSFPRWCKGLQFPAQVLFCPSTGRIAKAGPEYGGPSQRKASTHAGPTKQKQKSLRHFGAGSSAFVWGIAWCRYAQFRPRGPAALLAWRAARAAS